MSELRITITNILNSKANATLSSKEEKDKANDNILRKLDKIDGIKVDFKHPFQDIILDPILKHRIPVNCYTYALGLHNSEKYRDKVAEYFDKYRWNNNFNILACTAHSGFINYLLKYNYLKELSNPEKGCLVIYFDDNKYPKHAGILESRLNDEDDMTVRSKWGEFNALLIHKLWHVPCKNQKFPEPDYGACVKYYHRFNQEQAEIYYFEFIQNSIS